MWPILNPWMARIGEGLLKKFISYQVKDPALVKKLTPDYTLGCKRILISNNYFPALAQANVEVVNDGIREVIGRECFRLSFSRHRSLGSGAMLPNLHGAGHQRCAHGLGQRAHGLVVAQRRLGAQPERAAERRLVERDLDLDAAGEHERTGSRRAACCRFWRRGGAARPGRC